MTKDNTPMPEVLSSQEQEQIFEQAVKDINAALVSKCVFPALVGSNQAKKSATPIISPLEQEYTNCQGALSAISMVLAEYGNVLSQDAADKLFQDLNKLGTTLSTKYSEIEQTKGAGEVKLKDNIKSIRAAYDKRILKPKYNDITDEKYRTRIQKTIKNLAASTIDILNGDLEAQSKAACKASVRVLADRFIDLPLEEKDKLSYLLEKKYPNLLLKDIRNPNSVEYEYF